MEPSSDRGQYGVPPAPPIPAPAAPVRQPVDSALRLVIILMFVNLGLSVLTTILTLILSKSVIDYEIGHMPMPAGTSSADLDSEILRQSLQTALWSRAFVTVLVSALYVWRAFALRRGARRAYLRLYYIAIAGLIGIVYLIAVARYYPMWMRGEQIVQAAVLVGLLIAVSRKEVRNRFAKQPRLG